MDVQKVTLFTESVSHTKSENMCSDFTEHSYDFEKEKKIAMQIGC